MAVIIKEDVMNRARVVPSHDTNFKLDKFQGDYKYRSHLLKNEIHWLRQPKSFLCILILIKHNWLFMRLLYPILWNKHSMSLMYMDKHSMSLMYMDSKCRSIVTYKS